MREVGTSFFYVPRLIEIDDAALVFNLPHRTDTLATFLYKLSMPELPNLDFIAKRQINVLWNTKGLCHPPVPPEYIPGVLSP